MWPRSLRTALIAAVMLALLPIAALGLAHGLLKLSRDEADAHRLLRQSALAAAGEERNIFAGAEHLLRSLGERSALSAEGAECEQLLRSAIADLPYYANLARIDRDGAVVCSALPLPGAVSVTDRDWWQGIEQRDAFFLTGKVYSEVAETWIIVGVLPLIDGQGRFAGALTAAVDIAWLDYLVRSQRLSGNLFVALLDKSRRIIASNRDDLALAIVLNERERDPDGGEYGTARDSADEAWTYALAPLVRQEFFVAFAMRRAELFAWSYIDVGIYIVLPVAMIALSSLAIWLSTHRLILRWVAALRRVAGAYAKGHYGARADLRAAPDEMRQLGNSFFAMGAAIRTRDRNLRAALEVKAASMREIHHRVKNNLQIVMSLLTLQAVRLRPSPEREALQQARSRVNALALVHNLLHDVEDMTSVDIRHLLMGLAQYLREGLDGDFGEVELSLEVEAMILPSDHATPIALFLVEALTNAYKHAFPAGWQGDRRRISVLLRRRGEAAELCIQDNGVGPPDIQAAAGSGSSLMAAFARQLQGDLQVEPADGGGTVTRLTFPLPAAAPPPTPG